MLITPEHYRAARASVTPAASHPEFPVRGPDVQEGWPLCAADRRACGR